MALMHSQSYIGPEARARQESEGTSSTSCLHGSFTAVSPFNYVSQDSVVVSFQKKNMAERSCVNPRSDERVFSLLATMFGDQQHETLEEYIAAALILHVSNR